MEQLLQRLSPQERQVALSVYNLEPRKDAAERLKIARSTWSAYLYKCFLKLNVRSTEELVLLMEREKVKEAA